MSKLDELLKGLRSERMKNAEDEPHKKPKKDVSNIISDETGQYDARFMLWRRFCAENGVSTGTLPGDLNPELRERWEAMKNRKLSG